ASIAEEAFIFVSGRLGTAGLAPARSNPEDERDTFPGCPPARLKPTWLLVSVRSCSGSRTTTDHPVWVDKSASGNRSYERPWRCSFRHSSHQSASSFAELFGKAQTDRSQAPLPVRRTKSDGILPTARLHRGF